ncbi:ABC transporter ATP-binding protein [Psychromicrobium sp. YIM B11713]|uniref:ABC transporter ATP-binding protein n=1 Tax=Psychromicrobium sp. YIM B11713 TaxID=3145233 RepID=UPI00374E9D97
MELVFDGITLQVGHQQIVEELDLTASSGRITGLIGANGAGKSTILRAAYRYRPPARGRILIDGIDLWGDTNCSEAARIIAVLPQNDEPLPGFTVREVVALGRFPHHGSFSKLRSYDNDVVDQALDSVGVRHLAHRDYSALSGGERQKTLLARALAQEPRILILDEPTNHLDIRTQLEVMEVVESLGITTLTALHELNIAARYCQAIGILDNSRISAFGPPEEVFSTDNVEKFFQVRTHQVINPMTGSVNLLYSPLR